MLDRKLEFSTMNVLAWAFWIAAVTFIGVDLGLPDDDIGHAGILCGAAAGTVHIRGFFAHLSERERAAFDLGREAGRMGDVPQIH